MSTQNNDTNKSNNPYFFCYSINLYRQLKNNNLYYITQGTNPSSNRDFWVFEKSDKLKQILTKWSNNKNKTLTK